MFPRRRSAQESFRQRTQRRPPSGKRPCEPAESRLSDFCPLAKTPKQRDFLELRCREAFYGGAAGGGKSTALLMGALEHAYVPGYAALILRRDTQRLHMPGGLIPKSHEWLANRQEAKWNASRCQWTFFTKGPPATITFGYLQSPRDKFRYGSSEYQYIAFDELTELEEEDYLFLFSRLRRTRGLSAPLRVRSASNPGGPGHLWVKNRFVGDDAANSAKEPGQVGDPHGGSFCADDRFYIPARIADNPHLVADEYRQSLMHLPPVTRERLLNGDWSIQAAGQFRPEWLRYYVDTGDALRVLEPGSATVAVVRRGECQRFCTIDPASTSAEKAEASGREHSYSVIQVWLQPLGELARFLFLEHQWRAQVEFIGLLTAIRAIHLEFKPQEIFVEQERLGTAICQTLVSERLPIAPIPPEGKEKLARAGPLIDKFHRGEVLLPKFEIGWRPQFEAELLAWTGGKREPCDQIDAAAYAAIIAERRQPQGPVVLEGLSM